MPSEKNIKIVEELKDKLSKAKSVAFIDYQGLSADSINSLRQQVKDTDAETIVIKNTLLKIAIEENGDKGLKEATQDLNGPTMVIFSYSDSISPIKAVLTFSSEIELPKVKSAVIEGKYNSKEEVLIIRDLPSKEELIGKVVNVMNSPISGFVISLSGIKNKFVFAVNNIAKSKLEGGAK